MSEEADITRKKQTSILSWEFLMTMGIQTIALVVLMTTTLNKVDARVAALESQQVTAERIARIEERTKTLVDSQIELKTSVREIQVELRSQRR